MRNTQTYPTFFLALALLLSSCSDATIKKIAKEIVQNSDLNNSSQGLFESKTHKTNTQKIEPRIVPSQNNQEAQDIAQRINTVLEAYTGEIVSKGSLCNPILLEDTTNALMAQLESQGVLGKDSLSLKINLAVPPSGTAGNMIWMEIWTLQTTRGKTIFHLVFVEDGKGGAFFVAVDPNK